VAKQKNAKQTQFQSTENNANSFNTTNHEPAEPKTNPISTLASLASFAPLALKKVSLWQSDQTRKKLYMFALIGYNPGRDACCGGSF